MAQKIYIVDGRQFRTEADYNRAVHDKEIIDGLRKSMSGMNRSGLQKLKEEVHGGKYHFLTLLGQDFEDELEDAIKKADDGKKGGNGKQTAKIKRISGKPVRTQGTARAQGTAQAKAQADQKPDPAKKDEMDAIVRQELRRQEKKRKLLIALCGLVAVTCLGYVGVYSYFNYRTGTTYEALSELKDKPPVQSQPKEPVIHYTDGDTIQKEVLDEYKNLLNKNKKLIGWLKIDDTNIDYPVMQTDDNQYYLEHNLNQEYDKNGSIFMDKDCDVLKPSTNFILYGHHMRSGQMFGKLDKYEKQSYCEDHSIIQFDTIYEKGTYQVMYVFRSKVYDEETIVFKYYQFIDALSEQEFDSYMQEMAEMSLYDTGVTAQYGDRLLTLSTCDSQEKDGRFVVVAKKIA